jgi:membrane protein implicated in regulation of membrane protease activity
MDDRMTFFYLAIFIAGMLAAVWVMMYGVERPRDSHPSGERSFRISPPIVIGFSIAFGAAGTILSRRAFGTTAQQLALAVGLGVVVSVVAARLVSKWWTVTPEHDIDDERYVLQGHLARVTKPIREGVEGEVTFDIGADHRVLRARSFDDGALAAGTEVVIERIEDDVAYVEAWMEVEKRL